MVGCQVIFRISLALFPDTPGLPGLPNHVSIGICTAYRIPEIPALYHNLTLPPQKVTRLSGRKETGWKTASDTAETAAMLHPGVSPVFRILTSTVSGGCCYR